MPPTRRTLLRTAGTGAAALLAGCESLLGDDAATATATPPPTTQPGTPADFDALESKAVALLRDLAAGDFEAAQREFAPVARSDLQPSTLERVWDQLTLAYGQYVRVGEVEHERADGRDVLYVVGRFETGRQRFRFVFDDRGLVGFFLAEPETQAEWNPPAYADASAFSERDLRLEATEPCSLGATLSMPTGDDAVPGVVIVHGNGPVDRDLTVGPNKPYKDLAWGLASRGIAVLRYDKRTAACNIDLANATIDDVVTDDALTAIDRLRAQDRVRDDRVVLLGHSIGGTLAPRIAARDGSLAGAVLLAPLGRSVPRALLEQNRYLAELDGQVTAAEERRLERIRALVERIRSPDIGDGEVAYLGGPEYWRSLAEYDHLGAAADLDLPLYLAFGGRDYQVTVEADRPLWRDTLDGAGTVTFATYDDLNHLFIAGSGQPTPDEYFDAGNVDQAVVRDLTDWISAEAGT